MTDVPKLRISEVISTGKDKCAIFFRTEAEAAEVIRRCEAHEGLVGLQKEVGNWANRIFSKGQTTTGIINHLIKEVCELRDSDAPDEAADCLLLLFQHAHENGYDLLGEAKKKHEINLKRKWGKPDEYGVIEHIHD